MSSSQQDGMDLAFTFANDRDAPPVESQPHMEVHSWRLIKSLSGDLHLATWRDQDGDRGIVRLTSAISAIDNEARTVMTSSGRRYILMGPPDGRALERSTLHAGVANLGLPDGVDVSLSVWSQMCAD